MKMDNVEKARNILKDANRTSEAIEKMDRRISQVKEHGVELQSFRGLNITECLDDKTKGIIANIVLPELESKREELTSYLQKLLTGGIINDESK